MDFTTFQEGNLLNIPLYYVPGRITQYCILIIIMIFYSSHRGEGGGSGGRRPGGTHHHRNEFALKLPLTRGSGEILGFGGLVLDILRNPGNEINVIIIFGFPVP